MTHAVGEALDRLMRVASAGRFHIFCPGWSTGLGFSKLAGFSSSVEAQDYSYVGHLGNTNSRQFGRTKACSLTLERALDNSGFRQLYDWHRLARTNSPLAKVSTFFSVYASNGGKEIECVLVDAWCAKVELDPALAGGGNVITMRVTLECDSVELC